MNKDIKSIFLESANDDHKLILGEFFTVSDAIQHFVNTGTRSHELEQYLLNNTSSQADYHCATYAMNVLKKRWKVAEPIIIRNPLRAIQYAIVCNVRFSPSIERQLLDTFRQAKSVGKLRPLLDYITKSRKEIWPEAEEVILDRVKSVNSTDLSTSGIGNYYTTFYKNHNKKWKALETALLSSHVATAFDYYRIVLTDYGRWYAYEDKIKETIKHYEQEQNHTMLDTYKRIEQLYFTRSHERDPVAWEHWYKRPVNESTSSQHRNTAAENEALRSPEAAVDYCIRVLSRRWKAAEIVMVGHPIRYLKYVKHFKLAGDPYVEKLLLKHASSALCAIYANDIKKEKWPEYERRELQLIEIGAVFSYAFLDYCQNINGYRWKPLEDALLWSEDVAQCMNYLEYKRDIIEWPELEEMIKARSFNWRLREYYRLRDDRKSKSTS